MKLLLHTCCGPCFLGVWQDLQTSDFEVTNYFYNPNIQPKSEFDLRLKNLKEAAMGKSKDIIVEKYDKNEHLQAVALFTLSPTSQKMYNQLIGDLESQELDSRLRGNDEGEGMTREELRKLRCQACYRLRLEKTAQKAKELGFDAFSTTLLVSPYQQHEVLKNVGQQVGAHYGVDFYYTDWRPYFRGGQNVARENGIYRQKYCGCIFSKEEAGR